MAVEDKLDTILGKLSKMEVDIAVIKSKAVMSEKQCEMTHNAINKDIEHISHKTAEQWKEIEELKAKQSELETKPLKEAYEMQKENKATIRKTLISAVVGQAVIGMIIILTMFIANQKASGEPIDGEEISVYIPLPTEQDDGEYCEK